MAIVWFLSDIVEERAKEKCLYGSSLNLKSGYTARPLWNEWKICGKKERVRVEKERSLIKNNTKQILDIMAFGILKITNFVFEILETKQVKKIKEVFIVEKDVLIGLNLL